MTDVEVAVGPSTEATVNLTDLPPDDGMVPEIVWELPDVIPIGMLSMETRTCWSRPEYDAHETVTSNPDVGDFGDTETAPIVVAAVSAFMASIG
jgi:hypothetical protein